jgi:S-adenosylmethionine:tRNA ribosyltransferase-isomerase
MGLTTQQFDYNLPKELIAQAPKGVRSGSRLLVLHKHDGSIEHRLFTDIVDYLRQGDVLVVNDTKVLPARLKAKKSTGGVIDILLVEKIDNHRWACLVTGANRASDEMEVNIGSETVLLKRDGQLWHIDCGERTTDEIVARYGTMPLPHYIKRSENGMGSLDAERYQTIYAEKQGSIAAPTAGLHFTDELLNRINASGVTIIKITLHIGMGTFFLIKKAYVEEHQMHREFLSVQRSTIEQLQHAPQHGRIFAVGTSTVRTLETLKVSGSNRGNNGGGNGRVNDFETGGRTDLTLRNGALEGYTDLFIHPGYRFTAIDGIITNFHLPRSTPLLLACAFAGKENIFEAYRQAIALSYRFYSYGDAMLIL